MILFQSDRKRGERSKTVKRVKEPGSEGGSMAVAVKKGGPSLFLKDAVVKGRGGGRDLEQDMAELEAMAAASLKHSAETNSEKGKKGKNAQKVNLRGEKKGGRKGGRRPNTEQVVDEVKTTKNSVVSEKIILKEPGVKKEIDEVNEVVENTREVKGEGKLRDNGDGKGGGRGEDKELQIKETQKKQISIAKPKPKAAGVEDFLTELSEWKSVTLPTKSTEPTKPRYQMKQNKPPKPAKPAIPKNTIDSSNPTNPIKLTKSIDPKETTMQPIQLTEPIESRNSTKPINQVKAKNREDSVREGRGEGRRATLNVLEDAINVVKRTEDYGVIKNGLDKIEERSKVKKEVDKVDRVNNKITAGRANAKEKQEVTVNGDVGETTEPVTDSLGLLAPEVKVKKSSRSLLKEKLDMVERTRLEEEAKLKEEELKAPTSSAEKEGLFMSENMPEYAKSYILPRRMMRSGEVAPLVVM